jgi:hypothetical protein
MQTMVRGQTILIDPQLICSVIGVPVLAISEAPFLDEAPSIDFLHDFFRTRPLPDQHRCFCSYAPLFSKSCGDRSLASSSTEWAVSHPSVCYSDTDSVLHVQAHLAHYARGSRWEEHESLFWVFDHSNLPSGHAKHFRLGAPLTDSKSPWHEAQGAVAQPPPDLPTVAASSSSQAVPPSFDIETAFA